MSRVSSCSRERPLSSWPCSSCAARSTASSAGSGRSGVYGERTLIIGAGQIGTTFAATLEEHREYGLRPIGFLDDVDGSDLPLPLFGGVALLRMVLFEERVDRVVVAFGVAREEDMVDVLRACEDASVDIHILPRFFELGSAVHATDTDDVWGFPLVRLRRPVLRTYSRAFKRAFDMSVAGARTDSPLASLRRPRRRREAL